MSITYVTNFCLFTCFIYCSSRILSLITSNVSILLLCHPFFSFKYKTSVTKENYSFTSFSLKGGRLSHTAVRQLRQPRDTLSSYPCPALFAYLWTSFACCAQATLCSLPQATNLRSICNRLCSVLTVRILLLTVKILVLYLIRKDFYTTVPVVTTKLQNTIHRC